jgi:predicted MFS family arabinose efflux permease
MPMMVDRGDIDGAVSLNSVMLNGSRVVGPSLAAVLSIWGLTTAQVFLLNAISFVFLIAILAVIALPRPFSSHDTQGWRRALIGVRIVRARRVLWRLLNTLFLFSLFSLVFVALYPSVMRRNLGLAPEGATYKWLYAVWGLGAMLGGLAVSTALRHVDKGVLIVRSFLGFAASMAVFAVLRDPAPAFPAMFVVGFFYFVVITAMTTLFQINLHDGERANAMPLWIMAFGGTVTVGGLMFGPVIDRIGARWVLLFGALVALPLAWWCDLRRLQPSDFIAAHDPLGYVPRP